MLVFWILAIVGWQSSGYIQPLVLFGYIGTSLGVGLGLYAVLPKKKKQVGRKLTLFLIGGALLVFMGLLQSENVLLSVYQHGVARATIGAGLVQFP